jgi:hypothetical protein
MKKHLFILLAIFAQSTITYAADVGNLFDKRLSEVSMVEMHNISLSRIEGQEEPSPTGNQNLTVPQALALAQQNGAILSIKTPAHWSKELGQGNGEGPVMAAHGMYRNTFYGNYFEDVFNFVYAADKDIEQELSELNRVPIIKNALAPMEKRYQEWRNIVFGYFHFSRAIAQMERVARETTYGTDTTSAIQPFTPCVIDPSSRPLSEVLAEIKTFLDENRREIVVLKIENVTGSTEVITQQVQEAGMSDYAYKQNSELLWPRVEELVENNKRLVSFVTTDVPADNAILNAESNFVWSGRWDFDSEAALLADHYVPEHDPNYQRWKSGKSVNNALSRVPCHLTQGFAGRPDLAREVNTKKVITKRVKNIIGERKPTFLPLDFIDIGDGFKVVAEWNEER